MDRKVFMLGACLVAWHAGDTAVAQTSRVAVALDLRSLTTGVAPSAGIMAQGALLWLRSERGSVALGPEVVLHYQGLDRGAPCVRSPTVYCERLLRSVAGGVGLRAEYRARIGGLRTYGYAVPGLGAAYRRRDLNPGDCPVVPGSMPVICGGLFEERTLAASVMLGAGLGVEIDLGKPIMFLETGLRASRGNVASLWTPIALGIRW